MIRDWKCDKTYERETKFNNSEYYDGWWLQMCYWWWFFCRYFTISYILTLSFQMQINCNEEQRLLTNICWLKFGIVRCIVEIFLSISLPASLHWLFVRLTSLVDKHLLANRVRRFLEIGQNIVHLRVGQQHTNNFWLISNLQTDHSDSVRWYKTFDLVPICENRSRQHRISAAAHTFLMNWIEIKAHASE